MAFTEISKITELPAGQAFDIKSDNGTYNDMLSIAELQFKKRLKNNAATMGIRNSATAEQVNKFGDIATGIYRLALKTTFGTDWDSDKGATRQRPKATSTGVILDQHLTIEILFPEFDTSRYLASGPDVRAGIVNETIGFAMDSYIMSLEAINIRAIKDYVAAMSNKRPENNLIIDPAKITDAESARKVYLQINSMVTKLSKQVTQKGYGIDKSQYKMAISYELYNALTAYLPNFILNDVTMEIMSTGKMYKESLFGIPLTQHFMLNNKFVKDNDSEINKDLDFDFTGIHVILYTDFIVAAPIGMEKTTIIQDNNTLDPKMVSKNLGAIPAMLYGEYLVVGTETKLDATAAQAKVYKGENFDYTDSFQLVAWDKDFGTAPATTK